MSKPPVTISTGPWAGWQTWPHDNFETHAGPFYHRTEADGRVVNRFIVQERHINGAGFVHGGALMTFADYSVFTIAAEAIGERAVTVNLSGDYLGPAELGETLEATGEVTRAGGRVIYVRGLITANGRPCLSFTSVVMKVKPKGA